MASCASRHLPPSSRSICPGSWKCITRAASSRGCHLTGLSDWRAPPTPGPLNGQRRAVELGVCTERGKYTDRENQAKAASLLRRDGKGPAAGVPTHALQTPTQDTRASGEETQQDSVTTSVHGEKRTGGARAPGTQASSASGSPPEARGPALGRHAVVASHMSSGYPRMTPSPMFEAAAF